MLKSTSPYRALLLLLILFFATIFYVFGQSTQKSRSTHPVSFAVACGTPAGLSSSSVTTSSATLQWTSVSGAVSYNVQYRKTSTSTWTSTTSATNSKNISGLSSGTSYEFRVQTNCSNGLGTYSSNTAFSTLSPCSKPTGLSTTQINSTSARINWTNITGILYFNIRYRVNGTTAWTTDSSISNSKLLNGLSPATVYQFQVQTRCSAGLLSAFTSSSTFTTLAAACSVPDVNLFSSTNIAATTCTVGWAAAAGAVNYTVQYRIRNSGAAWASVTATGNSANLSGLTPLTLYEFQVKTNCVSSSSAYSTPGIFTTISNPCNVPDLNLFSSTAITTNSCTVGWAIVSGALSYNVQYRIRNSGSAWTTVSSTTNSKNLSGLSASTLYEFQVQTVCSGGTSIYSAPGIFTTLASGASCGTPGGLTVTGITTSGVTLNWTAVSGAISYSVQHRRTGATSWITASATSTSLVLTGLTASSAYEFQVQTVCSASSGAYSSAATFTTSGTSGGAIPVPDHIVICMFENHAYSQIIGNSAAPHINALANDVMSANFTESYGLTHPSQPNYIMFFSGGNQGVTNNVMPSSHFTAMNLAKALQNAGRTFTSYSDGMPSVGYDGEASGTYVRRHNPVANWMGTGTNQVSTSTNQPFTAFPTNYSNLPTVSFVVPDINNGMHDGGGNTAITTGDNWYYTYMEPYVQWARTHNSLFILTFDEDDNLHSNQIPTIFSGQMVVQGQYNTGINHYNVLRTIEDMYGLVHSGAAASAIPIQGCWTTGFRLETDANSVIENTFSVYPNPVQKNSLLEYELAAASDVKVSITGITGNMIYSKDLGSQNEGENNFQLPLADLNLRKGIYFLELQVNDQRFVKRFIKAED